LPVNAPGRELAGDPRTGSCRSFELLVSRGVGHGVGHGGPARSREGTTSDRGTAAAKGTAAAGKTAAANGTAAAKDFAAAGKSLAAEGTARRRSDLVVAHDWRALSHETFLNSSFRRAGRHVLHGAENSSTVTLV
jgi:hypothetical protein